MRGKIIEHLRYLYQRQMECELKNQFDGRFVAMFHQVDDNSAEWYDNQYAISFEGFVKFVNKLQKAGYEIVSPYDIVKKDGKKKAWTATKEALIEDGYTITEGRQDNKRFVIITR